MALKNDSLPPAPHPEMRTLVGVSDAISRGCTIRKLADAIGRTPKTPVRRVKKPDARTLALRDYSLQQDLHPGMRALVDEALGRGYTVEKLADAIGCTAKTLVRHIEKPHARTPAIAALARLLGYPPIAAKAIFGELTLVDVKQLILDVGNEIRSNPNLFSDTERAVKEITFALKSLPDSVARNILGKYVLAITRPDKVISSKKALPILKPTLEALERNLAPYGCSLMSYINVDGIAREDRRGSPAG